MPTYCRFSKATTRGFTLLELTIALLLIVALASWGLPGLQALGRNTAVISDVNRLQTAFSLARNTAITQRSTMVVCPTNNHQSACTDDWSNDIVVLRSDDTTTIKSEDIVRLFPAQPGTIVSYSRGWRRVKYTALGHASGFNGSFNVCSDSPQGKTLVLSQLGRLRIDDAPSRC